LHDSCPSKVILLLQTNKHLLLTSIVSKKQNDEFCCGFVLDDVQSGENGGNQLSLCASTVEKEEIGPSVDS
jgi:hypothetical protein